MEKNSFCHIWPTSPTKSTGLGDNRCLANGAIRLSAIRHNWLHIDQSYHLEKSIHQSSTALMTIDEDRVMRIGSELTPRLEPSRFTIDLSQLLHHSPRPPIRHESHSEIYQLLPAWVCPRRGTCPTSQAFSRSSWPPKTSELSTVSHPGFGTNGNDPRSVFWRLSEECCREGMSREHLIAYCKEHDRTTSPNSRNK